jgi:hypothetical protein
MLPAAALPQRRNELFEELKGRLHAAPGAVGTAVERVAKSGIESLDCLLGGGFPLGSLVTLEGHGSAGRWSIAAALLAQVTRRGLGAVIDDGELYPPALEDAGVRLDRLLVVPAKTPVGIARAVDLILRSRTARVIVMGAPALRAAVWTRLATLAHRAGAVLVVIAGRASAELAGVATVRLGCMFERAVIRGSRGLWGCFSGFTLRTELRKHKTAPRGGGAVSLRSSFLKLVGA